MWDPFTVQAPGVPSLRGKGHLYFRKGHFQWKILKSMGNFRRGTKHSNDAGCLVCTQCPSSCELFVYTNLTFDDCHISIIGICIFVKSTLLVHNRAKCNLHCWQFIILRFSHNFLFKTMHFKQKIMGYN